MQKTRHYEIGTCFFCMKCMFCASDLSKMTCICDKSIKPDKNNRTKEVKYHRNCFYSLNNDNTNETYVKKVQESVAKFGYIVDLDKPFYYSLCSSCNGKTYREKKKSDSINQDLLFMTNSLPSSTTSSIPSSTISSIPSSTTTSVPTSPISRHDSSFPETELPLHLDPFLILASSPKTQPSNSLPKESFKFKLQIKSNNDATSQPSSLIVMDDRPFDLFELKEKIRDVLDEKYGLLNYGEFKMIYKAENHCGAGNWLNNENELVEFLNHYDKLKKSMKMILIIVNVQLKRKVKLFH